nr:Uncharacterised protein [Ipomoea batatas]
MTFILARVSRYSAPLNKRPKVAAFESAQNMAMGVDSTSAQGQAVTKVTKAKRYHSFRLSSLSEAGTIAKEAEITTITAMYNKLTYFNVFGIFLTMKQEVESTKTKTKERVKEIPIKLPLRLIVPAQTVESFCFATGKGSPVKVFSSTSHSPSTTIPSIGIISPVLTERRVFNSTLSAFSSSPVSANTAL